MALKTNKVSPLGVLGQRQLSFIPEHFSKTSVNANSLNVPDIQNIEWWISYNLNNRYAICRPITMPYTSNSSIEIGFEDPGELVTFILGCPYLSKP